MVRIEVVGRLIEEEDSGLLGEERRDREAALLTARESVGAPCGEIPEVHGRERRPRHALILGRLPLPELEVWVAADQHGLDRGGDERILEVLWQEPEAQRHRAPLEFTERGAIEPHLPAVRVAQTRERVQGEGLARAVAAEDRHHLARSEPHGQLAHQLARAGAHREARRCESRNGRRVERRVHGRVQWISSAVEGPTTTSRNPCGISNSCADSARRPAMISA